MTVWMFVDPFASMVGEMEADRRGIADDGDMPAAVVLEYVQLEEFFRKAFPDREILFTRNVPVRELLTGAPSFYVFDIGGMCATDYGGHMRMNWCGGVLKALENNHSTGFVPWSLMTRCEMEGALMDLALGDAKEVPDDYEDPTFPNLFMLSREQNRELVGEEEEAAVIAWMRKFHGDKK